MCGILGAFYLNDPLPDPEVIRKVLDSMSHRGPDGRGLWYGNSIDDQFLSPEGPGNIDKDYHFVLGHRRLSIIDLELGSQPMSNEDNSIWICFNGEIYNHEEIKLELLSKGHKFKTNHSDTEVIIHGYEEWGSDCLKKLRGMFAFGIFDIRNREIFIARDRIGVKPLYYFNNKSKFIFASELKAIVNFRDIPLSISPSAIAEYFQFQYIPSPRSIFNEVKKLSPGHWIKVSIDKNSINTRDESYWDLKFTPNYIKSKQDWIEELDALLTESVKLRLISDVPVGIFLSGGIDSSTVLAYANEQVTYPLHTFSIGSREFNNNELPLARLMAKKYGTNHHEQIVDPKAIEFIPILLNGFDEPFADSSALPTYCVSQLASKEVKVVLSGDGGDEAFLGYQTYRFYKLSSIFDKFPSHLVKILLGKIGFLLGHGKRLSKFFNLAYLPFSERHKEVVSIYDSLMLKKLLRPEFIRNLCYPLYPEYNEYARRQTSDPYSVLQYTDIKTYLPEDILTKVDRMSMFNSLEVREPLLDHKLLEFVASIPFQFKYSYSTQKYILRETVKSKLTPGHLKMSKRGFSIPLSKWFRYELKNYVREILLNPSLFLKEFLDTDYISEIINDHQSGKRDFGPQLWSLLIFELWLKKYYRV